MEALQENQKNNENRGKGYCNIMSTRLEPLSVQYVSETLVLDIIGN